MRPRDVSLALVLTLTPGVVTAQPEPGLRVELAAFEKALDDAVSHVSRPGAVHLLGSGHGSRGYYLAGYGTIFVVPPRSLPSPRPKVIVRRRSGRGDREVQVQVQILERSLARVDSAEIRRLMEQSLATLRAAPEGSGEGEPEIADREPLLRLREARERRRRESAERERQLRVLEEQAAELQREAERVREVAERRIEDLMREVRVHLAEPLPVTPPTSPVPASAPEPTSPAAPPAPPAPPAPLPRPAPWSFWFELSETEEQGRSLETVITDIRGAMVGVLESHGVRLRTLRPEEVVVVAVDFVPRTVFPALPRPERTVLLRVKKKEVDARRAGQISSEELERRIEVVQY